MPSKDSVMILGAGIFGLTGAIELARRGHSVTVMDPGPIPHPKAASNDISKAVRMDYGSDEFYMSLMEEAFWAWDRWNLESEQTLYHQDGFLVISAQEMQPGGFEYESFQLLRKRGHHPERVNSQRLQERFPAWNSLRYVDGYFNPRAGWAESANVVRYLAAEAKASGVSLREGLSALDLCDEQGHISGVVASDGESYRAGIVIVAMGTWSPLLAPSLAGLMSHVAQPIFYLRPKNPHNYQPERFPVWAADLSRTGWYGFPATADGTVKVSNHGPGRHVSPNDPRETTPDDIARCRAFLQASLPELAEATLLSSRTCLYCDSWDGNFYIDYDPQRPGLVYATGGSGHAFKFTPVLGKLIADVVEHKPNSYTARFAWRAKGEKILREQARHQG